MKKSLLFLILLFAISIVSAQSLVEVIPAPNYSYGITHDGTNLWVGTSSNGNIHKLDDGGNILSTFSAATSTTRGLGWDGTDLWGYNYIFGSSSGKEDLIVKYNTSGSTLDSLLSPYEDYIGGMTYAAGFIYISVYYTGSGNDTYIIKIDPATNTFLDSIVTPGLQPQGLAYDGHSLYLAMDDNDNDPERIWEIDPATGDTIRSFPIPPYNSSTTARPRDLAYHNGYLYLVVGSSTDKAIYKFDLGGGGTPAIALSNNQLFFPTTTVGSSSSLNLNINNLGDAPLVVDSLRFNNSVYKTAAAEPITIDPSSAETITIDFLPQAFSYYIAELSVYSNDPINPVETVVLNGQGLISGPAIALSSYNHDFGNVWVSTDGVARFDLQISNEGDANLEISDMTFNLPEYTYKSDALPINIASNDTIIVKILFTPSSSGSFLDTLKITSNDFANGIQYFIVDGTGFAGNYSYGYEFWNYDVPDNPMTSFQDKTLEGIQPINDITGDGVSEVIIATENYYILCLDGAASGMNDVIWAFNMYQSNVNAGSIGSNFEYGVQDAMSTEADLNGDGFDDVVIAVGGGNEHVYALNGLDGSIIWSFGDDVNFALGDFQAVDVKRDYNDDGQVDVLAIADGNDSGTGYKRAYAFNGVNGDVIWSYQYPGPNPSFGKSIISVDDINGDSKPDAVIAVGNNGTSDLKVYGLDGVTGFPIWDFPLSVYEPKELLELPVPNESPDIIAAGYFGQLYRIDGETGTQRWNYNLGSLNAVIQMDLMQDLDNDGIQELLVASFASGLVCISGADGVPIWNYGMANQYGVYSVPDLNNDGIDDVITGDQDGTVYCITGDGQTLLFSYTFAGDPISCVGYVPSIDGNASFELLAGTRNGKVACFSGGLEAVPVELTSLTAAISGSNVSLNWSTATETNNQGFFIERKTTGDWQSAGFVEGKGNSTETNNYSYNDNILDISHNGIISYRLKQVDFDGSFEYSDAVEVELKPETFSLSQNYPNPFNPVTKINFVIPSGVSGRMPSAEGLTTLKVYDILGNQVATLVNDNLTSGYYEVEFDASNISSGVYFYRLESGSFTDVKKMTILK